MGFPYVCCFFSNFSFFLLKIEILSILTERNRLL